LGAAGTATLNLAGAALQTIGGAVTAAADGEGAITLNNTASLGSDVVFSGAIGTSSAALRSLVVTTGAAEFDGNVFIDTITAAAGHTLNFDGDVQANTALTVNNSTTTFAGDVTAGTLFNFAAAGTMTFDGTTAQTITGDLTTNANGSGVINVTNTGGLVTFADKIGVTGTGTGTMTLSASTNTLFADTVDVGDLSLAGTSEFRGAVTVDSAGTGAGNLTIATGSVITVGTGFASGATVITADGAISDAGTVSINMPTDLAGGDTLVIFDAASGTQAATYTANSTGLFTYTVAQDNTADTLTVTVVARSAAGVAATLGISTDEGAALASANTAVVAGGDAAALAAVNSALAAGGATARSAAEQIAPQADTIGAGSAASVGAGGAVNTAVSNRLASVRSGDQYASATSALGFSAGSGSELQKSFWLKPFMNEIDQSSHKGVAGYDGSTYGLATGFDAEVSNNVRLGVSYAYSQTDIDGQGTGKSKVEVDSHQVSLYGDYTTDNFYLEGSVGYSFNEQSSKRTLAFGGINRTASGNTDSDQFMLNVGAGLPVKTGSAYFTPTVGLSYTNVETDAFTETGAGNLNLTSTPDDVEMMLGSLGAKIHSNIESGGQTLQPMIRFGISYDFIGDNAATTAQYTGGGASFKATGAESVDFSTNGGVGLALISGNQSLSANYDVNKKDDFIAHSGSIALKSSF
jgi:outer membrane autotransporter protein